MTEVEKLLRRLEKMNAKVIPFVNWENNPSPEDVAREINKSLDEIEQGNAEEVDMKDWEDSSGMLY